MLFPVTIIAICFVILAPLSKAQENEIDVQDDEKSQYLTRNDGTSEYRFGYNVGPEGSFHHENRQTNGITLGCYGQVEGGQVRNTFYVADGWGFRTVQPGQTVEIFDHPHEVQDQSQGQRSPDDRMVGNPKHHHGDVTPWDNLQFPPECVNMQQQKKGKNQQTGSQRQPLVIGIGAQRPGTYPAIDVRMRRPGNDDNIISSSLYGEGKTQSSNELAQRPQSTAPAGNSPYGIPDRRTQLPYGQPQPQSILPPPLSPFGGQQQPLDGTNAQQVPNFSEPSPFGRQNNQFNSFSQPPSSFYGRPNEFSRQDVTFARSPFGQPEKSPFEVSTKRQQQYGQKLTDLQTEQNVLNNENMGRSANIVQPANQQNEFDYGQSTPSTTAPFVTQMNKFQNPSEPSNLAWNSQSTPASSFSSYNNPAAVTPPAKIYGNKERSHGSAQPLNQPISPQLPSQTGVRDGSSFQSEGQSQTGEQCDFGECNPTTSNTQADSLVIQSPIQSSNVQQTGGTYDSPSKQIPQCNVFGNCQSPAYQPSSLNANLPNSRPPYTSYLNNNERSNNLPKENANQFLHNPSPNHPTHSLQPTTNYGKYPQSNFQFSQQPQVSQSQPHMSPFTQEPYVLQSQIPPFSQGHSQQPLVSQSQQQVSPFSQGPYAPQPQSSQGYAQQLQVFPTSQGQNKPIVPNSYGYHTPNANFNPYAQSNGYYQQPNFIPQNQIPVQCDPVGNCIPAANNAYSPFSYPAYPYAPIYNSGVAAPPTGSSPNGQAVIPDFPGNNNNAVSQNSEVSQHYDEHVTTTTVPPKRTKKLPLAGQKKPSKSGKLQQGKPPYLPPQEPLDDSDLDSAYQAPSSKYANSPRKLTKPTTSTSTYPLENGSQDSSTVNGVADENQEFVTPPTYTYPTTSTTSRPSKRPHIVVSSPRPGVRPGTKRPTFGDKTRSTILPITDSVPSQEQNTMSPTDLVTYTENSLTTTIECDDDTLSTTDSLITTTSFLPEEAPTTISPLDENSTGSPDFQNNNSLGNGAVDGPMEINPSDVDGFAPTEQPTDDNGFPQNSAAPVAYLNPSSVVPPSQHITPGESPSSVSPYPRGPQRINPRINTSRPRPVYNPSSFTRRPTTFHPTSRPHYPSRGSSTKSPLPEADYGIEEFESNRIGIKSENLKMNDPSCPCYVMGERGEGGTPSTIKSPVQNILTNIPFSGNGILVLFFPLCPGENMGQMKQLYPVLNSAFVIPYQCNQCENSPIREFDTYKEAVEMNNDFNQPTLITRRQPITKVRVVGKKVVQPKQ